MPNLMQLLFGFNGRISRKAWWLGFVVVMVGSTAGVFLLHPDIFNVPPEPLPPPNLTELIWQLAWIVPTTAITVKRFNDRDWPFWFGYAFGAICLLLAAAPYFGLAIEADSTEAGQALFWVTLAVTLFAFVDNGFLRGTKGPNRYGSDPLEESKPPP